MPERRLARLAVLGLLALGASATAPCAQISVAVIPTVGMELRGIPVLGGGVPLVGIAVALAPPPVPGATLDPFLRPRAELILSDGGAFRRVGRVGLDVGARLRGQPGQTVWPQASLGVEGLVIRNGLFDGTEWAVDWGLSAGLGLQGRRLSAEATRGVAGRTALRVGVRF